MKDTTTLTRMHSSRMRTAHLLPVSPSMHCSGGVPGLGVYLVPGCVPGPRGWCVPGGCTWSEGGVPPGGVYLVREGGTCPGTPPLWTEWLTDRFKNITLPQTSFAGGNKSDYEPTVRSADSEDSPPIQVFGMLLWNCTCAQEFSCALKLGFHFSSIPNIVDPIVL